MLGTMHNDSLKMFPLLSCVKSKTFSKVCCTEGLPVGGAWGAFLSTSGGERRAGISHRAAVVNWDQGLDWQGNLKPELGRKASAFSCLWIY